MPPLRPSSPVSESESDTDAPESVPLTQAKKAAQSRDAVRQQFAAGEKEKRKQRNRERDRELKVRAGARVRGGKDVDVDVDSAESRMERAMREAQEESGDSDEDADIDMSDGDDDDGDEDYGDDGSGEEDVVPTNPNHLPDHLFASAFSSAAASSTSKLKAVPPKKRKHTRTPKAKDLVVGSRTIRVQSTTAAPAVPSTLPSRKIKKFTNRALALKGNPPKAWKRLPVNIGVMRRSLLSPAVGFVRTQ
ncbi:hypothetical protein B0H10DRAFT_2026811 [Mycena sp. CBHHK59/15]|nr:hypothetical protein B0H10DRAFT_2026811 [Mycena sp. CBHHK59/15]